jgi:hypothetical protein
MNAGLPTAKQMHDRISESRHPKTDPPAAPPVIPPFDIEKAKKGYKLMEEKGWIKKKRPCLNQPVAIKLPPDPNVIHINDLLDKTIIDDDENELMIMKAKIEENPHIHPYKILTSSLITPYDLAK